MVAGGKAQQERDPRPHLGQIDEAGGVIRLSPARSKTLVGRILPISHPIAEALARRRARRDPDSPLVFHRDGIPVRRWRTAWRTACQATGAPIRFLHDYRRRRPHPDPRPRARTGRHAPAGRAGSSTDDTGATKADVLLSVTMPYAQARYVSFLCSHRCSGSFS